MDLNGDVTATNEVESVGEAAFDTQHRPRIDGDESGASRNQLSMLVVQPRDEGVCTDQFFDRSHELLLVLESATDVAPSERAMVLASSVMSMPTGHHAIQRPQPTHPEVSNWSHHDESLWVIHWR